MNKTMPSITLSKNSIKFNKACHDRFDQCKHIEILYHPIYQTLAVRACDAETDTSICWQREDGKQISQFNAKAFMNALYQRMNWIEDFKFQFRGIYRERGKSRILFFALDEPRIYVNKSSSNIDPSGETVQYIKYKKNDKEVDYPETVLFSGYPEEWQNSIGLSHAMRKRRDRIIDHITENDICVEGSCAINPLIGEIPSKQEAMEELEALLIEM